MTHSLLDLVPASWIAAWDQRTPDFSEQLAAARRADVDRRRLVTPGPLDPSDVARLEQLAEYPPQQGLAPSDRPSMNRVVWARWWTFEDACMDALRASNFLSLAGTLRAWCEELAFIEAVTSRLDSKNEELRSVLTLLKSRGDDDTTSDIDWASASWAHNLTSQLNAYVHPNAAGHELAMHPENPRFFLLALNVIIEISQRVAGLGLPSKAEAPDLELDNIPPLLSRHVRKLPSIADYINDTRLHHGAPPLDPGFCQAVAHYSASVDVERGDLIGVEVDDPITLIAETPPPGQPLWTWRPELGFIQQPAGRLTLAAAVASWDQLEKKLMEWSAPGGRPAHHKTAQRLAYLEALCEAAVLVLGAKNFLLVQSLTRALNRHNPLATGLAARCLLEHHAAALRAAIAVLQAQRLLRTAPDGSAAQDDSLLKQEKALLLLLIGTSHQHHAPSPLHARAMTLGADDPLGLGPTIEKSFSLRQEFAVHQLWKRLSELVHGRTGALNPPNVEGNIGVTQIGLATLLAMDDLSRELDVLARFAQAIPVLQSARASVLNGTGIRQDWLSRSVPPYFVSGRDFSGSGTADDPYILLVGYDAEAYLALLKHLGITEPYRETTFLEGFGVADRVSYDEEVIYIVPAPQ